MTVEGERAGESRVQLYGPPVTALTAESSSAYCSQGTEDDGSSALAASL